MKLPKFVSLALLLCVSGAAPAFDHSHAAWDALLKQYVVLSNGGNASAVRYADLQGQRPALKRYLDTLSAVTESEYARWSEAERLAFLINAYNAFTVELILTEYPNVQSINDLGGLFRSPWKQRFFILLGEKRHLDNLEHELMRGPHGFQEPRIHFAVNCASIGCPMLRNEAYTAKRLDAQLEDGLRRFLSDGSRNRFDGASATLQVSKIFDWYREDFEQGHGGFDSLEDTFAKYAGQLAESESERQRIRAGQYRIQFLDYDWRLNDAR
jgi:Protein of unknown function, DUF547